MNKSKGWLFFLALTIALSAGGLSCGISNFPNPFATDIPTSTATFTLTPTFTPSPTATSTPTQTPTSTPLPTGIETQELSDGSTLFIDYDNKYQLTLPESWVIIPLVKEDLEAMLDKTAKDNPEFAKAAEAFKGLDSNVLRMVALNSKREYLAGGYASNITVAAIGDPIFSAMPLSFITGALEESFTQQGIKVLTSGVNTIENANDMDIEFIDVEQNIKGVQVKQKLIVFQSNKKLIIITVSTLARFEKEIFAVAEQIGASVELLK